MKANSLLRATRAIIDQDGSLSIGKFPSVRDSYSKTKGKVLALRIATAAGIQAATLLGIEDNLQIHTYTKLH